MTAAGPTACLLSTGEEVLRGEILDSNNHWLARTLGERGFEVQLMLTAGDRRADLAFALGTALERADWLFMSGGLGPTDDDLTTAVIAELTGVGLEFDEPSWAAIRERFRRANLEAGASNRKQAFFPQGARVLPNRQGTAPGFVLRCVRAGAAKTIVALPGPPRELQPMLLAYLDEIAPRRDAAAGDLFIRFLGLGESQLAERLEPWSRVWGPVSFRQAFPELEVKLYQPTPDRARALREFAHRELADCVLDFSAASVVDLLGTFLRETGRTLALAESCTGGLAAKLITDAAGSSAYFVGGVVSYANAVKEALLGVDPGTLASQGAVSEPVALQMARGARARLGADLALGFTGIAGPDGGSAAKPVGTVWIARAGPDGCAARRLQLGQSRERIRQAAVAHGFRWLLEDWLAARRRPALAAD